MPAIRPGRRSPSTWGCRITRTTGAGSDSPTSTWRMAAPTACSTRWSYTATRPRSRHGRRRTATRVPTTYASRCSRSWAAAARFRSRSGADSRRRSPATILGGRRRRIGPGNDEPRVSNPAAADQGQQLLAIYDRALPQVYGYLRARVRDDTIAEDITAETFLAAVGAVRERRVPDLTVAWLVTVARNKLVDHWRRTAREERGLRL